MARKLFGSLDDLHAVQGSFRAERTAVFTRVIDNIKMVLLIADLCFFGVAGVCFNHSRSCAFAESIVKIR